MEFIQAKSILSKSSSGDKWFGIDYNMNLYRGCSHGCIYCDSRSDCYRIEDFDRVRGKADALAILEKELSKKKQKGVIGIGTMSDPYNPCEKHYMQTREALKLIEKYGFGVSIETKSDLILRDLDILEKISHKNNVILKFTITTPHDNLSKVIEPNVCASSKRFQAVKECSDRGLFTGILLTPVLPFITDKKEDIKELIKLASEHHAAFIYNYMGVTLRANQRDYYYKKLDQHFPLLKQKYMKTYKEQYFCASLNYQRLNRIFTDECRRYHLLYRMEDIIKAYKKERKIFQQESLF